MLLSFFYPLEQLLVTTEEPMFSLFLDKVFWRVGLFYSQEETGWYVLVDPEGSNAFDRLFDNSMFEPGLDFNITGQLALDVAETEDEFEVKAVIPGINPDDWVLRMQPLGIIQLWQIAQGMLGNLSYSLNLTSEPPSGRWYADSPPLSR